VEVEGAGGGGGPDGALLLRTSLNPLLDPATGAGGGGANDMGDHGHDCCRARESREVWCGESEGSKVGGRGRKSRGEVGEELEGAVPGEDGERR
jgi:hypothetical protein